MVKMINCPIPPPRPTALVARLHAANGGRLTSLKTAVASVNRQWRQS
jgi:hypothetical protein